MKVASSTRYYFFLKIVDVFSVVLPPKYAKRTATITFSKVSFHNGSIWKTIALTLSRIPAKLNTTTHHIKTIGCTFFESQESLNWSSCHRNATTSNSLTLLFKYKLLKFNFVLVRNIWFTYCGNSFFRTCYVLKNIS